MRWPSPPLPPVTTATVPLSSMCFPCLFGSSDAEQPRRGSAQDGDALVVVQSRRVEHEIDLRAGPRERVVGPDHDLTGPGFRDQVAQRLGREDDRVEEELSVLEIGGRLLLWQR